MAIGAILRQIAINRHINITTTIARIAWMANQDPRLLAEINKKSSKDHGDCFEFFLAKVAI